MVIKKFLRFLLLLICGFCVVSSVAFAEDGSKKPNCAFTWTFYSNYIWQGLELSKQIRFFPLKFKRIQPGSELLRGKLLTPGNTAALPLGQ